MLDLNDLAAGLPAISPAFGRYLAEAGSVCFESQGHDAGVSMSVRGMRSVDYGVNWPELTDQVLRCLNDPEVATELGAVGVAVLLAKRMVGYTVVQRSRKGTGFDYWLGGEEAMPFQNKARLEISGIRKGDARAIAARVRQKLSQVTPSDGTGLPAFVVVVEFGQPQAEVREK